MVHSHTCYSLQQIMDLFLRSLRRRVVALRVSCRLVSAVSVTNNPGRAIGTDAAFSILPQSVIPQLGGEGARIMSRTTGYDHLVDRNTLRLPAALLQSRRGGAAILLEWPPPKTPQKSPSSRSFSATASRTGMRGETSAGRRRPASARKS